MMRRPSLLRSESGAAAAEFALTVPLLLLFILGTIDVGLYAWSINQGEKATQIGARYAVATDMVPSGLKDYSFVVDGNVAQGEIVPVADFPGVRCDENSCTCAPGGSCGFPLTHDAAAFANIVARMNDIKADVASENVFIDYDWSGLGYAGDPNGPDVAPIVTVRLENMTYSPVTLVLFGGTVGLPNFAYSLTAEDSEGTIAN